MTAVDIPHARATTGVPGPDGRGSWVPTWSMVTTRTMELRRRRGLMITLLVVVVGLPSLFLGIRVVLHLADPTTYGAAGGADIFTGIVAGVLSVFGFIVAAMIGCTAGTSDLADGMFRHLVVTGRSRLALYLARIPAALAIVLAAITAGYTIVCVVCCLAAPTQVNYQGVNVPPGLSKAGFVAWSVAHADRVDCQFDYNGPFPILCGPNGVVSPPPGSPVAAPTPATLRTIARRAALQNYEAYTEQFRSPPVSLMVDAGLWLLLEATIGVVVGLGLGSLLGQRTVAVILMIVLEIVLTPLLATARLPYLLNLQRAVVGIATDHLEPNGLSRVFGVGGGSDARSMLVPEATFVAVLVVLAWLVVWTVLGAWRMVRRDA